jgi:hypothetical protein
MPNLIRQMTHSIDSFITDSANSATALYSGKKSTVDSLNVFVDSVGSSYLEPCSGGSHWLTKLSILVSRPTSWMILSLRRSESFSGGRLVVLLGSSRLLTLPMLPQGGSVLTPEAVRICAVSLSDTALIPFHAGNRYQVVVQEYLYNSSVATPSIEWPTSCKQPDVIFGYVVPRSFARRRTLITGRLAEEQNSSSPALVRPTEPISTRPSKTLATKLLTTTHSLRALTPRRRLWVSSQSATWPNGSTVM